MFRKWILVFAMLLLVASTPVFAAADDQTTDDHLEDQVEALKETLSELGEQLKQISGKVAQSLSEVHVNENDLKDGLAALKERMQTLERSLEENASEYFSWEPAIRAVGPADWTPAAPGWEYRRGTIQRQGAAEPRFLVDFRRTGAAVSTVKVSVTFYDKEGAILATGDGELHNVGDGAIRTLNMKVSGPIKSATDFRVEFSEP